MFRIQESQLKPVVVTCVYSHESNVVNVSIMQFCMTGEGLCCRMQDRGALSVRHREDIGLLRMS